MRSRLSRVIPMPFQSRYLAGDDGGMYAERSTWWQWRGRVWRVRVQHGW